jgi:hypothetical protein
MRLGYAALQDRFDCWRVLAQAQVQNGRAQSGILVGRSVAEHSEGRFSAAEPSLHPGTEPGWRASLGTDWDQSRPDLIHSLWMEPDLLAEQPLAKVRDDNSVGCDGLEPPRLCPMVDASPPNFGPLFVIGSSVVG